MPLTVFNRDGSDHRVAITDHMRKGAASHALVPAGKRKVVILNLGRSFCRYDLTAAVEGFQGFLRRFAGRVETGRTGYSDPGPWVDRCSRKSVRAGL